MKKPKRMFVIEFRSGSLFVDLAAEHGAGGPDKYERARKFPTRRAARRFADRHVWIYFNGGMLRRAAPTPAERFCWEFEDRGRRVRQARERAMYFYAPVAPDARTAAAAFLAALGTSKKPDGV